jgi:pimeloyl-ACP methyl ester carboxylesterase
MEIKSSLTDEMGAVWQQWLREHQPRLLVLWGKDDPSFAVAGAEAYRRDVPKAEVHVLDDAGHFATEDQPEKIIALVNGFLEAGRR